MDYTVHSAIQVHETRVLARLDKIVGFLARKRNATATTIRLVGRIERTVLYICHGTCIDLVTRQVTSLLLRFSYATWEIRLQFVWATQDVSHGGKIVFSIGRVQRHRGHCSYRYPADLIESFREKRFRVSDDRNCRRLGNVFLDAAFGMALRKLFEKARLRWRAFASPWNSLRKSQNHQLLSRRSLHRSPGTVHTWLGQRKHMLQTMLEQQCCYSKFPYLTYSPLSKKELRKWLSFGRRSNLVTSAGLFFNRSVYGNPVFLSSRGFLSFMKT